jgi:hypothetical protein
LDSIIRSGSNSEHLSFFCNIDYKLILPQMISDSWPLGLLSL